jgi:predicted lipid-binding transport protein (Tim44 family)
MFRLQAFPKSLILFSLIIFVANSVAPAAAQYTGSQPRANNAASASKNATANANAKQMKQGYVSTQQRMGCKMSGNCQR